MKNDKRKGNKAFFYTNKIPHRWWKKGNTLIQLTPSFMMGDGKRCFEYETIEDNRYGGSYIVGFNRSIDMVMIQEEEWHSALLNSNYNYRLYKNSKKKKDGE